MISPWLKAHCNRRRCVFAIEPECGGMIRPPAMDRLRTIKLEAATRNGGTRRTRPCYGANGAWPLIAALTPIFVESLIFSTLLWMQQGPEPSSSEGDLEASKAFKLHVIAAETLEYRQAVGTHYLPTRIHQACYRPRHWRD
jgi:hypothetical protein